RRAAPPRAGRGLVSRGEPPGAASRAAPLAHTSAGATPAACACCGTESCPCSGCSPEARRPRCRSGPTPADAGHHADPPGAPAAPPPAGPPPGRPTIPRPDPPRIAPVTPAARSPSQGYAAELRELQARLDRIHKENHFQVLGLPETADSSSVKAAYFKLAKQ